MSTSRSSNTTEVLDCSASIGRIAAAGSGGATAPVPVEAQTPGRALDDRGAGELAGEHGAARRIGERVVDDVPAVRWITPSSQPLRAGSHPDRHLVELMRAAAEARLDDHDRHERVGRAQDDDVEHQQLADLPRFEPTTAAR